VGALYVKEGFKKYKMVAIKKKIWGQEQKM
jgi:hypothetical protein